MNVFSLMIFFGCSELQSALQGPFPAALFHECSFPHRKDMVLSGHTHDSECHWCLFGREPYFAFKFQGQVLNLPRLRQKISLSVWCSHFGNPPSSQAKCCVKNYIDSDGWNINLETHESPRRYAKFVLYCDAMKCTHVPFSLELITRAQQKLTER